MLKTKLAGSQTKLAAAIASVLDETREKMKLAAEKDEAADKEKVKKLVSYEKKGHGGKIPSPADEKKEHEKDKESSAIDPTDPEEVTKLASALDEAAALLEKEADAVVMGGESHQGGQVLPVQSPAGGTQPVPSKGKKTIKPKTDGKPPDSTAAGVIVGTDLHDRPSLHKKMPDNVLKTAGVDALKAVVEKTAFAVSERGHKHDAERAKHREEYYTKRTEALQKQRAVGYMDPDTHSNPARLGRAIRFGGEGDPRGAARHQAYVRRKHEAGKNAYNPFGGAFTPTKAEKGGTSGSGLRLINPSYYGKVGKHDTAKEALKEKAKEKKSAALDFVLGKLSGAELGGESKQGGETLASHDKPAMQPGRKLIQNAQALKNVTKPEAKAPRKAELAEVLTEPASKRGVAENIHGNLRSASKGGVKTAAAKALLAKIAEEGCKCDGKGTCPCCKMKKAAAEMKTAAKDAKATA